MSHFVLDQGNFPDTHNRACSRCDYGSCWRTHSAEALSPVCHALKCSHVLYKKAALSQMLIWWFHAFLNTKWQFQFSELHFYKFRKEKLILSSLCLQHSCYTPTGCGWMQLCHPLGAKQESWMKVSVLCLRRDDSQFLFFRRLLHNFRQAHSATI